MTTLRDIFNAFAPEYLARYPNLPTSHRKAISAIQHCQSGHYGHSLSQCQSCGEQHRVNHSCGNRHCPQCQQHKTQQWLHHHLDKQLPGPHFLLTFTVPETLRPFIRSHQRLAYQAMFKASSQALKRLAKDERFIGTDLPGFTRCPAYLGQAAPVPPPHPLHRPRRWPLRGPHGVAALQSQLLCPRQSPLPHLPRLFKEDMRQAGLLEHIDPQVWTIPWNVHSQANPHGHSAFTYLAPYVFKVAISNSRIVSLKDRTVTFTYRKPGSARPRTTHLDVMEFLRRFLQHVLPDGFMKVRHFGFLHASCALPPATLRLMIVQAHPIDGKPTPSVPPQPLVARCPTCGAPMRVVMRLWTSHQGLCRYRLSGRALP